MKWWRVRQSRKSQLFTDVEKLISFVHASVCDASLRKCLVGWEKWPDRIIAWPNRITAACAKRMRCLVVVAVYTLEGTKLPPDTVRQVPDAKWHAHLLISIVTPSRWKDFVHIIKKSPILML